MRRVRAILPVMLMAGFFAVGCGSSAGGNDNHTHPCNHDNVCDPDESAVSCDDCAGASCTLTGASGDGHDFLVSELYIPASSATAQENGVDLNGDGVIDNKLGSILSLIASRGGDSDVNESVNQEISDGNLLLVGRVYVDQFGNDQLMLAQVLRAVIPTGGSTPIFDGNDVVALDPETPQDLYLCGRIMNNNMEAGPDDLGIVFPIPGIGTLDITLERVQLIGRVTANGMENVMLGGGLSKEEIETNIYPTVVEWANAEIAADATGSAAIMWLDLFDDRCESTLRGCDPLPEGCALDGVIDIAELTCNALLDSTLAPDVDIDYDGVKDLLSLGIRIVSAVPVTVIAPSR